MAIRIGHKRAVLPTKPDPFSDLLFNVLLGISMLFFVAILFINPQSKAGEVTYNAYFVITVTWPDRSPDDIDVWVADPLGNRLWFRQREVGLLHLDRDDRGRDDDAVKVEEEVVETALNQEVVTFRGVVPGRYTVNVHYYKSHSQQAVKAQVRIFKLRPNYALIVDDAVVLEEEGVEKTVVNMRLGLEGQVAGMDRNERPLVFTQ